MIFYKKTGIDIISSRITKIEKKIIFEILNSKKKLKIVDIASGSSFFGLACVFLHQNVFLFDAKIKFNIKILKKVFRIKNLKYEKKNLIKINYKTFPKDVDIFYCSRFLHYLKYKDAISLLKIIKKNLSKNGKIYFSISGIESELAKEYVAKKINIKNRFDFLSNNNQKKFFINQKVCLYSKKEVECLFSLFFDIEKIWQSDFGNIFIIASNKK